MTNLTVSCRCGTTLDATWDDKNNDEALLKVVTRFQDDHKACVGGSEAPELGRIEPDLDRGGFFTGTPDGFRVDLGDEEAESRE